MLKIGVQSRGIINEDYPEIGYKLIKKSGMTSIDYNIIWENLEEDETLDIFHKHKEYADKNGLVFSQVHSPRFKKINYPDDLELLLEKLELSIKVCEILKAPYLVVHPIQLRTALDENHLEYGDEFEKEINFKYFERLGEIALNYNVTICIENLFVRYGGRISEGFCSRADDIVFMIEYINKLVGKEVFGACFDIGHANALRKNLKKEVITLGKHLKCLHIHDNDGCDDSHQLPYTFTIGKNPTTDFPNYLLALREIGFKGAISFEPFKVLVNVPGILQKSLLSYMFEIGKSFSYVVAFDEVLKEYSGKKIILFGAGKMFDTYYSNFVDNFPPEFIVDNNSNLWDNEKNGFKIFSPQKILEISENDRCVVICNAYFEPISQQLENMGVFDFIYFEEIYRMHSKPF